MELRTLRALVEVVRRGGFSQAAEALFTTQPNVSKAVRRLEDDLGVPLLERIGHQSRLTDAGRIVYRRARRMLAEGDDLLAELDELRGLQRGRLRLGLPLFGSSVLFAPIFALFRVRYPGVEISLVEHGSKRLEELLRAGEVDLAASLLPVPEEFEWQDVRAEPLVALLPGGHALTGREAVSLQELAHEPFILFEEGFLLNQVILDACSRRGFRPLVAARSGQIDFIVSLVKAGLGIALLPRLMAEQRRQEGVRHVLLDEPDTLWHMALLWRRGGYLPHAARVWLELAREAHAGAGAEK
ncbi:LysR family transcriptional regulator [Desulfovibrio aminophilus]|uniref:LysR family transcriptional regulator n=1 Tax=Desulfovibrio aminophilus TaxID=81425 RepID=UPI000421F80F|nr:LysR family transcriptional regulator [Desulfovibrio aminophilus]